MDNITHSLAGLLVGEAVHDRNKSKETESRRGLFVTASIIANNFPDIDAVYTGIMPPPLGDLLHHRGHTHTLLLVPPQILIVLGILFLVPRFRRQMRDRGTLKIVTLITLIGFLLHFFFDSWNSYGIHALYPLTTKWFYGDLIFIIEPFLWIAFAVPLALSWRNLWARTALFLLVSAVPLIAATQNLLTWYSVASVAAFAFVVFMFAKNEPTTARKIFVGVCAATLFLAIEGVASYSVRTQLRSAFQKENDQHRILDLVLSPLPANPLCWTVIQLEVDPPNDRYISSKSTVSAWPSVVSTDACTGLRAPPNRTVMKISDIVSTVDRDCYIDAWMRFARAPHIEDSTAFDLRYSQAPIDNFTKINVSIEKRDCPRFIPPWSRPRQDLLDIGAVQSF